MMPARRFPPPWPIEEYDACYIVKDRNAQALADVYYENEPGRRTAANLLTRDEARRVAANIAKFCRSWCGRRYREPVGREAGGGLYEGPTNKMSPV
jgi:hypothetical protein